MKIKSIDIDMFSMVTITLDKPIKTIENANVNITRDLNSSNLNLEILIALNRDKFEGFNLNSTQFIWTVSNQTNLIAGIIKI